MKIDQDYITHVRRPHDKVEVLNVDEIMFPESVKVENLDALKPFFDAVVKAVTDGLKVTVNAPEVNVTTTPVVVPAASVTVAPAQVNIPKPDYTLLLKGFNESLRRLHENSTENPLEVNIDDSRLLAILEQIRQASKDVMLGFPGAIKIQNATGGMVDFSQVGVIIPSTLASGVTNVTTAGTSVLLATSLIVKSVTIKALSTNTGIIYVGNSTVSAANGFQIKAGESISLNIANLNLINLDCSVSGEGVSYMWVN